MKKKRTTMSKYLSPKNTFTDNVHNALQNILEGGVERRDEPTTGTTYFTAGPDDAPAVLSTIADIMYEWNPCEDVDICIRHKVNEDNEVIGVEIAFQEIEPED